MQAELGHNLLFQELRIQIIPVFPRPCFHHISMTRNKSIEFPITNSLDISFHTSTHEFGFPNALRLVNCENVPNSKIVKPIIGTKQFAQ